MSKFCQVVYNMGHGRWSWQRKFGQNFNRNHQRRSPLFISARKKICKSLKWEKRKKFLVLLVHLDRSDHSPLASTHSRTQTHTLTHSRTQTVTHVHTHSHSSSSSYFTIVRLLKLQVPSLLPLFLPLQLFAFCCPECTQQFVTTALGSKLVPLQCPAFKHTIN